VEAERKHHQACLHLTNEGTQMGGSFATPTGTPPFTLTLLLLITHHSAPHKNVTAVKDGHTFTQDLMNWRSRTLAASDARSDRIDGGKERS
jgi:hypothetical protein